MTEGEEGFWQKGGKEFWQKGRMNCDTEFLEKGEEGYIMTEGGMWNFEEKKGEWFILVWEEGFWQKAEKLFWQNVEEEFLQTGEKRFWWMGRRDF